MTAYTHGCDDKGGTCGGMLATEAAGKGCPVRTREEARTFLYVQHWSYHTGTSIKSMKQNMIGRQQRAMKTRGMNCRPMVVTDVRQSVLEDKQRSDTQGRECRGGESDVEFRVCAGGLTSTTALT